MAQTAKNTTSNYPAIDQAIGELSAAKDKWAQTENAERIAILQDIKDKLITVSEGWAKTAARKKLIPASSPLVGEEWTSGPYTMMGGCNSLMETLSEMDGKKFLNHIPVRELANGQIAAKIIPHSIWDHLLLSGVKAEVWMQKGVTAENLKQNTAAAYDQPAAQRKGKVALVLGAGNIAAIAPLDCFQKLFCEHQVVVLKMNPVNDYLAEFLQVAMQPLIERDALRIVKGGVDVGEYLCNHPDIEEIHITGAQASHDAIVWGSGDEAEKNKKANTPINTRRITSELGAVCPTIVVPGPWSKADLKFQAEHIATQKMHNSGFNCVACQMLILPSSWDKKSELMDNVKGVMARMDPRLAYYPGAKERLEDFESRGDNVIKFERGAAPACVVVPYRDGADAWFRKSEIFAPALSTYEISESDAEKYLVQAIKYANEELHGTLGANIIIHPKTIKAIGDKRLEEIIADFHYGCIGINAWSGLGFLLTQVPWGAFPGHTLDDAQSGIGFVHNSFMFDKPERTIVSAPFKPYPRNLASGSFTLLPRPPWFITNKRQHKIGELLTRFVYKPGWAKIPAIFANALLG